jgi:hypothetical protein
MRYLIRAVKYFFYFAIILALILGILVLIGFVEPDPDQLFRNGTRSLWQIGILFAIVAAVYPKFGFVARNVMIPGEYAEIRPKIVSYLEKRGYRLESEEGENLSFRLRSKLNALTRMLEDRITLKRALGGFQVEGITKDVVRLIHGLEYAFRNDETEP